MSAQLQTILYNYYNASKTLKRAQINSVSVITIIGGGVVQSCAFVTTCTNLTIFRGIMNELAKYFYTGAHLSLQYVR